MKNIIFYFSGTGNSLQAAKTIAKELEQCAIVSMAKPFDATAQYDSIGFIYPTYFWGLPKKVIAFIESLHLQNNKSAYYYAVTTYGGSPGNALNQLNTILRNKHGIMLNYGHGLQMFSNYVVMYEMRENIDEIAKKSNQRLVSIVSDIKTRQNKKISALPGVFGFINKTFINNVSCQDKYFNVNESCTGCGVCKEVCPVKNIDLVNGKPEYAHHCEQCVACIQFCPQKAINYKKVTQNRRRYTNPEITFKELSAYNNAFH
jgi:ferredoxin/flavodoxin